MNKEEGEEVQAKSIKKKIYQECGTQNQAGVAVVISKKVDFKPKLVRRNREGPFIFIKVANH
jgi:hypothetical protein